MTRRLAVAASGLLATILASLAWAGYARPDVYYALLQEDGPVEWATFFAFTLAATLWGWRMLGEAGALARAWPATVALFSAFVAGEEISWGQRLSGVRAPSFFLTHNFQQELNLHNLASRDLRELAVGLILCVCVVAFPSAFAPAFAATLVLYLVYPLPFTGELVELVLGVLLLIVAMVRPPAARMTSLAGWTGAFVRVVFALAMVSALSLVATRASVLRAGDAVDTVRATRESAALAEDFVSIARIRGKTPTECGTHQRLLTFVRDRDVVELHQGQFAALSTVGADRERLAHFLDPWNQAYWIRHACGDDGRESAFAYSFGPNRRRDSGAFVLGGDDVGTYLLRAPSRPSVHVSGDPEAGGEREVIGHGDVHRPRQGEEAQRPTRYFVVNGRNVTR